MNQLKKIAFVVLMMIAPIITKAQLDNQPVNLPKYDYQKLHFGFALGFNSADFRISKVGNFNLLDSIYGVESSSVAGFNLSILANLRIGQHFDLRFIPTLSFAQRNLKYRMMYGTIGAFEKSKQIESSYLEFPFDLKFKSKRVNNYRVYVLAGFKYAIDMVSQAKVNSADPEVIKLKRKDYGYEIGLGLDCYLSYFKFSPEIKMYNGLTNLLVPENTIYASPIEALYSKTFTVSLTFE